MKKTAGQLDREIAMAANRDRATGRYVDTIDRMCRCGHPLSLHTAARVAGGQPCISGDLSGAECACASFKAQRKR